MTPVSKKIERSERKRNGAGGELRVLEKDVVRKPVGMLPPDWVPYPEDSLEQPEITIPIRNGIVVRVRESILDIARRLHI